MSNVPLPEPDCRLPMDGPPRYRADQMHAHAAAVSAADNARLREALRDMVRHFENCPEEQSNLHDGAPEPITQWDYDAFQILGQARAALKGASHDPETQRNN